MDEINESINSTKRLYCKYSACDMKFLIFIDSQSLVSMLVALLSRYLYYAKAPLLDMLCRSCARYADSESNHMNICTVEIGISLHVSKGHHPNSCELMKMPRIRAMITICYNMYMYFVYQLLSLTFVRFLQMLKICTFVISSGFKSPFGLCLIVSKFISMKLRDHFGYVRQDTGFT